MPNDRKDFKNATISTAAVSGSASHSRMSNSARVPAQRRRAELQGVRKGLRNAAHAKRRKLEPNGATPSALPTIEAIQATVMALDGEPEAVIAAAGTLRALLSRGDVDEDGQPVAGAVAAAIVGAGGVPRLARVLAAPIEVLQLEASWCLTNIAADAVESVASAVLEAAPQMIAFAGGGGGGIGANAQLREQCTW